MKDATSALAAASSEVINKHDQYEVIPGILMLLV